MNRQITAAKRIKIHLDIRVSEAKSIGLLPTAWEGAFSKSYICLSSQHEQKNRIPTQDPNLPLDPVSSKKGWQERYDLFDYCANWICSNFSGEKNILICLAGLCEVGDKVLQGKKYILVRERPMFWSIIKGNNQKEILEILRWSRAISLLGIIGSIRNNNIHEFVTESFVCDVFDGDTLIFCPSQSYGVSCKS